MLMELGTVLDRIGRPVGASRNCGRRGRRRLEVAAEGPSFTRHAIAARVRGIGVAKERADGLAWLLHNGEIRPSALSRLASGQPPASVFADQPFSAGSTRPSGGRRRRRPNRPRLGRPPGTAWHDRCGLELARPA